MGGGGGVGGGEGDGGLNDEFDLFNGSEAIQVIF